MLLKELLPLIAGELRALIGMNIHLGFGLATPDGHQQGLQRQIGICVFRVMMGIDFRGSWAVISRDAGH